MITIMIIINTIMIVMMIIINTIMIITMIIIMIPQEQSRLLVGACRGFGLEERLWGGRRETKAL